MRQEFFDYIGKRDSLAGYQRSNRLILLKTFFALCDKDGRALVNDVVNGYKNFYKNRKDNGLIPDIDADAAIENIETSTYSDVLSVIKRHPYRVLNEKGFITISQINQQDFFVLNKILNASLSETDIRDIRLLLSHKINLYYSKIDSNKNEVAMNGNYNDTSEQKVEFVFPESCYLEFRNYCKECNIVFTSELEPIDFVAFRSKVGASFEFMNRIKNRITLANSGEFVQDDIKCESYNRNYEGETIIKNYAEDELKIQGEYPQVAENSQIYSDKRLLISNILTDGVFKSFNQFCEENNLKYIEDLDGFDFKKLLGMKGFGLKRIENIISRFNEVVKDIHIYDNESQIQHRKLVVSKKMRFYIEQLINLNASVETSNQFADEELEILDKFATAVNEVGMEMCRVAYLNPLNTAMIIATLSTFSSKTIAEKERIERLHYAFKNINESNKEKIIYPLVMAYTSDVNKIEILTEMFDKYTTINELPNKFVEISKNDSLCIEAIRFMDWLQNDLIDLILKTYKEVYKKDIYKDIIHCRASGGTLEAAGHLINVTRERVRQIEKKIQLRFDHYNSRKRYIWIIAAFLNGKKIIGEDEITDCLGENSNSFVYLLKNSNCTQYCYLNELKVFMVGEQVDLCKLKESICTLPDIITLKDIDSIIDSISVEHNVTDEIVKKTLGEEYKLSGRVYHRKKISLTEMYEMILKSYYPSGAKLFDKVEQDRFRRYIIEMFGDVKLPLNYRALDARVADIGVLCDRGTYIHSDYIKVDMELMNEIKDYIINGEKGSYTFLELYENFKEKLLLNSNINNRYFLQGVLKFFYKADFYFTRDMISKSADIERIDDQIEDFVAKHDIVTKEQLRNEFIGITEAMLFFAVGRCRNVIAVENGMYMHVKHLNIYESDYEIDKLIDNLIIDMPVSSRKLLQIMYSSHTEFLNRNLIFTHTKLFSILQFIFRDKYKFSRPFIAKQETEDITKIGVVRNYLRGREFYEISELIDFCDDNHLRFLSWSTLIDDLSDEFIRADSNLCVNIQQIDINEGKIETIKNIMLDIIGLKGYISARKIKDYMFFPDVGVEWNGYLLKSIIDKYIPDIEVLPIPTSDTYLLSVLFLNEASSYNSYEDFLRSSLKSEHNSAPFKDLNEVKQWLQEEELINQNIPKFMLDKNYLYVDEFGKILVE